MFSPHDTIVAISTPPGHGGIGIVRVSGPRAQPIARGVLAGAPDLRPRRATFARVLEPSSGNGAVLDQVVVTWFEGPASYTGDDVVEISAHGSPVTLGRIVQALVRAGARPAAAGEFTLRAFLNGKLDLPQAEAVADLVEAVTPEQARAACEQLEGRLGRAIGEIEAALFDVQAELEAAIDFPDEGDRFAEPGRIAKALDRAAGRIGGLLAGADRGRLLREGRHAVIVGPPNSGKSTLFNALLGSARAIVAPTPGTTRDVLVERCAIDGVPITLVDTAGLRATCEPVEAEGVARALAAGAAADLLLVVSEAAGGNGGAPGGGPDPAPESRVPRICVTTKIDLPPGRAHLPGAARAGARHVAVSAVTGEGLDGLRRAIVEVLGGSLGARDGAEVTNVRHVGLLERAQAAVARARSEVARGGGEEVIAVEVREALDALQEVTGRRASSALLDAIFSRFCIGK